jgi:sigma-54 dependent transcriptional regulator, flagellar regulatory protein
MVTSRSEIDSKNNWNVDNLLLGKSDLMQSVRARVRRAAPSISSILITGPSGSGKERVARAIHAESLRSVEPFVAINCGAIPRELLESELFGHAKGSFTGAHVNRRGRFEEAHRGTLFLDEIGDMPADMQVKLLRVLEERKVERVGGGGSVAIDVRIISATHRNLHTAIEEQRFREDLYYRLAVFPIDLPPLSAHIDDLSLLIVHFLSTVGDARARVNFSAAAMAVLERHAWPGNVRELRNMVERAAILHPGETLGAVEAEALLLRPRMGLVTPSPDPASAVRSIAPPANDESATFPEGGVDLRALLADTERSYIMEALRR